ncbi:uncharacterized protein LOC120011950 isoform X3 [Tripterygium wilfordii]|uniref:uncharacterized protein LOC120011950 isoform X3 n=1 Tax=Tripterygium wilfordii TaxID=458696 RepID=UPI0018F8275C|nr:uncharacterized protein LOC120011950 isoform X3 [Tripterygium wilfordii]
MLRCLRCIESLESDGSCSFLSGARDIMSGMRDVKEQEKVDGNGQDESEKPMPSSEEEEVAIKKKYGGIVPKKPPLISKTMNVLILILLIGRLESKGLRSPRDLLKPFDPSCRNYHRRNGLGATTAVQRYYPHNSRHDTGNLLMPHPMVKMGEALHLRRQLRMNEELMLAFNYVDDC